MMDTICVKEVIIANLTRRGAGKRHDPVRVITEVYEKDGTLIAEKDPVNTLFVAGDLVHFATWCITKGKIAPAHTDVPIWLDEIENSNGKKS